MFNNNYNNVILASIATLFMSILFSLWLFSGSPKIAVIDLSKIYSSDFIKAINSGNLLIKDGLSDIVKSSSELRLEISKKEEELSLNRSKMRSSAIEEAEKDIYEKKSMLVGFSGYYAAYSEKLTSIVLDKVSDKLSSIVPAIADSYGYDFIIQSSSLFDFDKINKGQYYDITDLAIEELNKALPSVDAKDLFGNNNIILSKKVPSKENNKKDNKKDNKKE